MSYLYPLRLAPSRLIATDIGHAITLALLAGSGHLFLRNIDFSLLGLLVAGSIPAVMVEAWLSSKFSQPVLCNVLAVVLAMMGLRLWFSSWVSA